MLCKERSFLFICGISRYGVAGSTLLANISIISPPPTATNTKTRSIRSYKEYALNVSLTLFRPPPNGEPLHSKTHAWFRFYSGNVSQRSKRTEEIEYSLHYPLSRQRRRYESRRLLKFSWRPVQYSANFEKTSAEAMRRASKILSHSRHFSHTGERERRRKEVQKEGDVFLAWNGCCDRLHREGVGEGGGAYWLQKGGIQQRAKTKMNVEGTVTRQLEKETERDFR